MTPEEIKQIKTEIEDFKNKSLQTAATSKAMSAHYHRLYMASKASLKRFDRMERALETKQYAEARKKAKANAPASASKQKAS